MDPISARRCLGNSAEALGYLKQLGDFNQLSFTIYPITVALMIILGRLVNSRPSREALLMVVVLYLGVSEYRALARQSREPSTGRYSQRTTSLARRAAVCDPLPPQPSRAGLFPFQYARTPGNRSSPLSLCGWSHATRIRRFHCFQEESLRPCAQGNAGFLLPAEL